MDNWIGTFLLATRFYIDIKCISSASGNKDKVNKKIIDITLNNLNNNYHYFQRPLKINAGMWNLPKHL